MYMGMRPKHKELCPAFSGLGCILEGCENCPIRSRNNLEGLGKLLEGDEE